jgi:UDP-N-acetylmuramate dehydrogenase
MSARIRRHGVQLATETSFQIGGQAAEFYQPHSIGELQLLLGRLSARQPFILGGGCNTLFPDDPFRRPIISTAGLRRLELGATTIRAEAGVGLGVLIRTAIESGLGGLETLVGIPGTVGGATVMNAGIPGCSWCDRVQEVGVLDRTGGAPARLPGREIPWGYRSWNLEGYVVGWVVLELTPAETPELRRRARECLLAKHGGQPVGLPSAGCVFKNPPGRSAGAMIDSLGLKGLERGGATVSERHANFIVNREGRASSADVKALIQEVRARVEKAYRVRLETEIVVAEDG